jgi:Uma2 family endonuclease
MVIERQRMTIERFERFVALPDNAGRVFELIDGELVEKMPTEEHGFFILVMGGRLLTFVNAHKLGWVTTDARHRLPKDKQNALRPDISYISFARKQEIIRQGAVPLMPDLAVEIQSPDDSANMMRLKAIYYLNNGSQLVWLVFPTKRQIEVWTPNGELRTLGIQDVLEGGDVLPGFTLPLREIFQV